MDSHLAHYQITLDGKTVEADGVTCLIDNAGTMGIKDVKPAREIQVDDGFLDVLILGNKGFRNLIASGSGLLERKDEVTLIEHWQAREITIQADPPQPVTVDGEMVEDTPLDVSVIPRALRILVPKTPSGK